jgi:ADP-L-glycero-D-manno-heptose 6-epimerase
MLVVTGANGFIGSALISDLNRLGAKEIIASDFILPSERPQLLKGKVYKDFLTPDELVLWLKKKSPEIIFHIGACSDTTERNWDYLKRVNLDYSKNLFEVCSKQQIPFFYASSGAVYGSGNHGFDDERDSYAYEPLNLYGKSKKMMDVWALEQDKTPPRWAGFRFFNVYGPNEYFKNAMASLVYKAFLQIHDTGKLKLFKSENPLYKDGCQMRDFVYVKDITRWIIECWQKPNIQSGIYNMGYGQANTWLTLAQAIFSSLNKPMQIDWINMPDSLREQYQYFTEAKMDKLFGQGISRPQWTVEKGVEDYIKNYLLKDQACY